MPEEPQNISKTEISQTIDNYRRSGPVDVACETMYREIETQTDPWSPDYVIVDEEGTGQVPEIFSLGLHELTYANGQLPVGLEEVEAIARIQDKQRILNNLPPPNSKANMKKRREILEEQELSEWQYRELLIKREHDARLKMISEQLEQRELEIENEKRKRLDQLLRDRRKELEFEVEKINSERIKQSRKYAKARDNLMEKIFAGDRGHGRDIIKEYVEFDSKIYAPNRYDGNQPEIGPVLEVKDTATNQDLEETAEINAELSPKIATQSISCQTREGHLMLQHLNYLDRVLNENETNESDDSKKETALEITSERQYRPIQRPPTPKVKPIPNHDSDNALKFLQALIRGRETQLRIQKEVEENVLLIEELRQTTEKRQNLPQEIEENLIEDEPNPKEILITNVLKKLLTD